MVKAPAGTAGSPADGAPADQREATRRRLIDAAIRRFRRDGYDATTAASIAADAGVTERTFFRHFPTKADVLVANWERHADALRAVLASSTEDDLLELVRAALLAFAERVQAEVADAFDTVLSVYADRSAYLAIVQTVLAVEDELATAIAARTGHAANDALVRVAANASVGVFRAAMRAAVAREDMALLPRLVDDGIDRLRDVYADLEDEAH